MSIHSSQGSTGSAWILLVNSNRSGLAARKAILEEVGHRVTAATSGEDAWEHLSASKFDLVVTEYKMAKMNGIELVKRIRGLEPAVPIIMLSGYVEALGLTESSTGADAVLAKSAKEVPDLLRTVSRLLRQSLKKPVKSQTRAAAAGRRKSS
jgi:CheY-like chemotaxis protein